MQVTAMRFSNQQVVHPSQRAGQQDSNGQPGPRYFTYTINENDNQSEAFDKLLGYLTQLYGQVQAARMIRNMHSSNWRQLLGQLQAMMESGEASRVETVAAYPTGDGRIDAATSYIASEIASRS